MPQVSRRDIDRLIADHVPVVHRIARSVRARLPPHVDLDDLASAGIVGLIQAARKFDHRRNVAFTTYAGHRIRGAITDSLRELDPLSRDLRRKHSQAEDAIRQLCQKLKRLPRRDEVAAHLSLPPSRWQALERQISDAGHSVTASDRKGAIPIEVLPASDGNPEITAADRELRRVLNEVAAILSPRYAEVIRLYYREGWTMKRIGQALGVNESRISQIHAAALCKLRRQMEAHGWTFSTFRP